MNQTALPIACTLTDSELRERRETVLRKVAARLIGFDELENGFSFRFPAEDAVLLDLINVINLERKCCAFLSFKLSIESNRDSVALELTGAAGAKEMLKTLFEWN